MTASILGYHVYSMLSINATRQGFSESVDLRQSSRVCLQMFSTRPYGEVEEIKICR